MERVEQLKEMLVARTDGSGKPLPGYRRNVEMVRAEITRLEKLAKPVDRLEVL